MLRIGLRAGVAVAALALYAPAASAGHAQASCTLASVVSGQSQMATVTGSVVAAPGEAVTVRCVVKVNGATVGATPTGSGTAAAFTADVVQFSADSFALVTVCAQYTSAHGGDEVCSVTPLPVIGGVPPACVGYAWVDGDSCELTAPLGAIAFSGQASVPSGTATVTIEVVAGGVVLGSCTNTGALVANCSGTALSPGVGTPLLCVVGGSGGSYFQCGDPPPLPGQR